MFLLRAGNKLQLSYDIRFEDEMADGGIFSADCQAIRGYSCPDQTLVGLL